MLPCAGLTEVTTTRLAAGLRFAMGCMRGRGGAPCLACMKCYRKEALRGRPIPPNAESERELAAPVIRMLPSLKWCERHRGLRHPVLEAVSQDVAWAEAWYAPSLAYVPERLRGHLLAALGRKGVRPLEDDRALRAWDARNPLVA